MVTGGGGGGDGGVDVVGVIAGAALCVARAE